MKFYSIVLTLGAVSAITDTQTAPCEPALDISKLNLAREAELFSRTFDKKHYNNAIEIAGKLGKGAQPKITTWELLDKSFAWPRVR